MATIVNTPASAERDSGSGFLLGAILLIVFLALFFFYGLPFIGNMFQGATSSPQVNVPDKIDVNVQNPQGQ